MKSVKPKIIIIHGPTASGKSDAAIRLAKAINGEIISADSRQIYKGLNIGSGKVVRDKIQDTRYKIQENTYFSEGIAHHLIDVAQPLEDYNISHFKKDAGKIIQNIVERGKIPIICGGTNFWIDSIVHDSQIPEVAPNEELRKELQQKSAEELFSELQKLDPERAKNIDAKNKVRLIRAIEICKALGSVPKLKNNNCHSGLDPESTQILNQVQNDREYDFLQLGISTEREKLNEKIKLRLEQRFKEGMIEEVENLSKNGVSFEWMEKIGLEYRWISRYLQNKVSLEEMKEKLYFDIIHYAKRQMTWLKRNKEIIWTKEYEEIETEAKNFLKKS
jgi:tRNA dimethylallyltransferase